MSIQHRIAAYESWARTTDRAARTQPARDGLRARFERQVDPDDTMTPQQRSAAADAAMKAHFLRMAQASAAARRS